MYRQQNMTDFSVTETPFKKIGSRYTKKHIVVKVMKSQIMLK